MSRKPPLRRIVVDGVRYRWRVKHHHRVRSPVLEGAQDCEEHITIHREGVPRSCLRISFAKEKSGDLVGYPAAGCVNEVNLNRPAVIAELIRLARTRGWQPEHEVGEFRLEGRPLLDLLPQGE